MVAVPAGAAKMAVPAAPVSVMSYPLADGAVVTWDAPVLNTSGAITSYTAAAEPGGESCATSKTTCNIAGLVDGVAYTVQVTASAGTVVGKASKKAKVVPSNPACATIASGADLQGCNLSGRSLANVKLKKSTNMRAVDLDGANLGGTSSGAAGEAVAERPALGANLSGADLSGVISGDLQGTPSELPPGWIVANGYLVGPGADLTGADLTGADLTGADLTGTILTGATITGATFPVGAYPPGYGPLPFYGMITGGLIGTPASLPEECNLADGYIVGPWLDLAGADLAGADLYSPTNQTWFVDGADLAGADLSGATFRYVEMEGADLSGADLNGATLDSVNFGGSVDWFGDCGGAADLSGADFTGATIEDTGFVCVDLQGTIFTDTDLIDVSSGSVQGVPASLPANWTIVDTYLIGPTVQLNNAGDPENGPSLDGADLSGLDLAGSWLQTSLVGANLSDADLTNADIIGGNLDNADLSGAILTGTTYGDTIYNTTTCPDGTLSVNDSGTCLNNLG